MKYSKKYKKKVYTKQKKKTTKNSKKSKKHKKYKKKYKGGAAEEPPPPHLITQPSGQPLYAINQTTGTLEPLMENNIETVYNYLQDHPWCKTSTNCLPLSSYVLSSNFNPKFFEDWINKRDEWEKQNQAFKEKKGPKPASINFIEEYTQQKELKYVRNISSRPPIQDLFETENKMWTNQPLKDFIRDLIQSGIHQKNYINYMKTNAEVGPPPVIEYGCIQVILFNLDMTGNQKENSHAINICRGFDNKIIIVDLQNYEKPIIREPEIDQYLNGYSPNIFIISTTNDQKYQEHEKHFRSRLDNLILNIPLIQQIGKTPPENLNTFFFNMMRHTLHEITPSVFAFPYDKPFFTENEKILFPIILGGEQGLGSSWPPSVINSYNKYYHFQDNKYPQIIRETALSAILNGIDNETLDNYMEWT
jgi:hypothetical protein